MFLVGDELKEAGAEPKTTVAQSGPSVVLHLETEEVEVAFNRAVDAGATVTEEISERSWGARCGKVKDPYGFIWSLATPIKASPVAEADDQE